MSRRIQASPPTQNGQRRRWEMWSRRRRAAWSTLVGTALALVAVALLQRLHAGEREAHELSPLLHWLRDGALAVPIGVLGVWTASRLRVRRLEGAPARVAWAFFAALIFALGSVPGNELHARLFGAHHHEAMSPLQHLARDGSAALLYAFVFLLAMGLLLGVPWEAESRRPLRFAARTVARAPGLAAVGAMVVLAIGVTGTTGGTAVAQPGFQCTRTVDADVVALDQPFFYNRLGTYNPAGMIYALRGDVVVKSGVNAGKSLASLSTSAAAAEAGNVTLRPGKRARPLTLRMDVGDCLEIGFQNMLAPTRVDPDQPADRHVGIHVNGLLVVDPDGAGAATGIDSDGSFVGKNASSLAAPGETKTYELFGEHENTYLLENLGVPVGGEGNGGTMSYGLFGAVNVEPYGTQWYRSQVTRVEMNLAAAAWTGSDSIGWSPTVEPQVDASGNLKIRLTPAGQPVINYDARYPSDPASAFFDPLKAGLPILNMLDGLKLVHSDLNAIIAGPAADGFKIPKRAYPASYWSNQIFNMNENRGQEPFREFTVIFHDEIFAKQAFDLFTNAAFKKVLGGVKDGFAINYGTGGIGAEIIANRLGVGPMWNSVESKYEEFFLTSWVVGDPAEVVDIPANTADANGNLILGPKATKVLYPDDPSNVHHSYLNDRVKFRNLHAGPKEHHIFHLHTHQWTFTPNTDKSTYLDSQMVGPGSGYTYEIAFGGSGNRNKVVGDAIFHCHFYPHFAQGMWEFWRTHDTFERGTALDGQGRPESGSRALPDGEITAGTPIPAIVPLPTRAMAPMPAPATTVVPYDMNNDGTADSAQVDADGNGIADFAESFANAPSTNPGFPFFIPGVAGHRPPTPALDIVDVDGDGQVEDGGLPRHVIIGGTAKHWETPLDFNKTLETAKVVYVPEDGTPTEKVAMGFHSQLWHPTFLTDGKAINSTSPVVAADGRPLEGFETNGLPAVPGAPYAEPCRSDPQPNDGWAVRRTGNPRLYKGAVVQMDATINKLGWHFPQQRWEGLWNDVGDYLTGKKAPEPLVMRLDSLDCADFWHTNLVPNVYQLDDYQVRTPTDVLGQHIHLVKFDVTSADGSGNGFNYEDGTLSPQEVTERINAVRAEDKCGTSGDANGNGRLDAGDTWTKACPLARAHPFFKNVPGVGDMAWGARTTIQRWYADPILNNAWDRGLGAVFTHDHFGPSTHQQVGLYSTVLVEPEGSQWRDSETGAMMGGRSDGGPTSWRADIVWPNGDARNVNAHREFYFEFADFQHAYQAGGGKLHTQDNGAGVQIPSYADFKNAINPSFRQEPPAGHESDLYFWPPTCANGLPRPCAEAISADDVGTYVVNYRNEPVAARVFDPSTGKQAAGDAGDLALAFQSRTDRKIPALNTQPSFYPPLTSGVKPGDPWTPMMRVYMGDKVRIRAQVGATEEEHNLTIHGLKWRQEEFNTNSGWRDTQAGGISEYFNLQMPVLPDVGKPGNPSSLDYLYEMGSSTDDLWNGIWGLLRSYGKPDSTLQPLPNNQIPAGGWTISNNSSFNEACPVAAPVRSLSVTAVRAADVLGPNGLVYNNRTTTVKDENGAVQGSGPLIDPTAILYVDTANVVLNGAGKAVGLKPGTPVEPIVLRAAAGDCIKLRVVNKLPAVLPDQPTFNALPGIMHKNENLNGGVVSFNDNDIVPSSSVGLHAQLVQYDVRTSDGLDVGGNSPKLVTQSTTNQQKTYLWYAGDVQAVQDSPTSLKLVAKPVEYGAINLMPADRIKGSEKGMVGGLVVEPQGSTWAIDPGSNTSATVTMADGTKFREFVTILQTDVGMRYGGGCTPSAANLGCAVPGIGAEAPLGPAEDNEDGGQKAINYGAEPLWFRLGLAPSVPFENPALLGNLDANRVYSNSLVGGDPKTPVFKAAPYETVRMRLLEPGGHARGAVFAVDGHAWQREPYVNDSDRISWTFQDDPTTLDTAPDGLAPGRNLVSQWVGSQEGVAPSSHFDLVFPEAGGRTGAAGDYLFRDNASYGNYQGLWGVLRVGPR